MGNTFSGETPPLHPILLNANAEFSLFFNQLKRADAHQNRDFYQPFIEYLWDLKQNVTELNPDETNILLEMLKHYRDQSLVNQAIPEALSAELTELINFIRTASE